MRMMSQIAMHALRMPNDQFNCGADRHFAKFYVNFAHLVVASRGHFIRFPILDMHSIQPPVKRIFKSFLATRRLDVTSNTRYGWHTLEAEMDERWTQADLAVSPIKRTVMTTNQRPLKIFIALGQAAKAAIARIWPSDNMHKLFIYCCRCGCAAHKWQQSRGCIRWLTQTLTVLCCCARGIFTMKSVLDVSIEAFIQIQSEQINFSPLPWREPDWRQWRPLHIDAMPMANLFLVHQTTRDTAMDAKHSFWKYLKHLWPRISANSQAHMHLWGHMLSTVVRRSYIGMHNAHHHATRNSDDGVDFLLGKIQLKYLFIFDEQRMSKGEEDYGISK